MRNWKRRANLGYADARKQSRQEVMHLLVRGLVSHTREGEEKHDEAD